MKLEWPAGNKNLKSEGKNYFRISLVSLIEAKKNL